ncbi:hypothetical protein [Comamonas thiooxydans]|uniref:hypothetical protein n=1 Tax=Comamonas thiooxydans TaxID=363952 RepID=UPI00111242D7|nr:hypothetical protein [Comamonas thiooxydans]
MTELTDGPIVRVGVDLSKRFYQVHSVDQWGHLVLAKSLSPERFYAWCAIKRVGHTNQLNERILIRVVEPDLVLVTPKKGLALPFD